MNDTGRSLVIYCDGASRSNPGLAALGVVVYEAEEIVKEVSEFLGDSLTNNQAEYLAVIESLKQAQSLGASRVVIRMDSELAQRQLTGQYKVKNALLKELWGKVAELAKEFEKVKFEHIPREKNKEADRLANQALDKKLKGKRPTLSS